MYVFRVDVGARHLPSRRATVCDYHEEYSSGVCGQSNYVGHTIYPRPRIKNFRCEASIGV